MFLTSCAFGEFELSSEPVATISPTELGAYPEEDSVEESETASVLEPSSTAQENQDYKRPKVKVYSADYCPHCDSVKIFLQQNGIDFEEINLDEDSVDDINYVPITEIGNERVIGWNEERLKELLNID